jgi:hypothetical protein
MYLNSGKNLFLSLAFCGLAILLAGCASTGEKQTASTSNSKPISGQMATRFKATDGRTIEIGRCSPADGGMAFKEPHMDKCWIADGFNFSGYDTLYIAPTASTAKLHNDAEQRPHELAKENLPAELEKVLRTRAIFSNIVLRETDIKPGARVLKMENTIVDYAKGGGAARYFAGLYGAGQPVLRVQGKMTDGDKPMFLYEARRSGVSAGARMTGAFMKDEDIQVQDIRSMSLDLADFMSAVNGTFQPK